MVIRNTVDERTACIATIILEIDLISRCIPDTQHRIESTESRTSGRTAIQPRRGKHGDGARSVNREIDQDHIVIVRQVSLERQVKRLRHSAGRKPQSSQIYKYLINIELERRNDRQSVKIADTSSGRGWNKLSDTENRSFDSRMGRGFLIGWGIGRISTAYRLQILIVPSALVGDTSTLKTA
ncbi:MAG: hypothetical protein RKR03_14735 [Candidatus Competibacter sp.]|nr:hypothetical protein [Candidatus Competibacter sp.]